MIKIESLNKRVLKDFNLHIKEGELVILKGISGSGKSTLLSIIGGLMRPFSGKIIVDSENIYKLPDLYLSEFRSKKIGFVSQQFNLFENLTVFDNLSIPLIPLNYNVLNLKDHQLE